MSTRADGRLPRRHGSSRFRPCPILSRRQLIAAGLAAPLVGALPGCGPRPDIHYVPTPMEVVAAMLEMANIRHGDILYDLGSGDGRIPIQAALQYGIRGVGIEIDRRLIGRSRDNAEEAGVAHLVSFRQEDLFTADFSDASVIALYLGEMLNLRLRPRLLELDPGTRVVSQSFGMGDWIPSERREVANRQVYKWIVPEQFVPGFPVEEPRAGREE